MRTTRHVILTSSVVMSLGCSINIFDSDSGSHRNVDVEVSEPFLVQLDASTALRIRLEGVNGIITVRGGSVGDVARVEAERRVRSDTRQDAQQFLERVTVEVAEHGGEILVRTSQPSNAGGREVIVDYDLTIPARLDVDVTTVNGLVTVLDVVGDVEVSLVNGNIDCDVAMLPAGLVDLSVVNGNVELDVPTSTSAMLDADVVNGSIGLIGLTLLDATTSTRSVHGRLGAGDGLIDLDATNGTITVRGR